MSFFVIFVTLFLGLPVEDHLPSIDYSSLFDADNEMSEEHFYHNACNAEGRAVSRIEPGMIPEGDCVSIPVFSTDGMKLFIPNAFSENITVVDWSSKTVDTVFNVGGQPCRLACSDSCMVISMPWNEKVEIYSMGDYSRLALYDVSYNGKKAFPWEIRISDDSRYAYVACFSSIRTRTCVKIDLQNHAATPFLIDNFESWAKRISGNLETNRYYELHSAFEVLPGGRLLAEPVSRGLNFRNTTTGGIDHSIVLQTTTDNMALSGDGKYLFCWNGDYPLAVAQIDLSSFTIKSTVEIPGATEGFAREIAVNFDGTKVLIGTSSAVYMINFETSSYKKFTAARAPYWVAASHDHSMAISTGRSGSTLIFDFASEAIVGKDSSRYPDLGCASPVDNSFVTLNPMGYEGVFAYSFTGTAVQFLKNIPAGPPVEGDAPRNVAIAPDGSVAVTANYLSGNISIVDLKKLAVDAILEIGHSPADVAITSDSKWAVVCYGNGVKVVDLKRNTIVADVTGFKGRAIAIRPDDAYAYVASEHSDELCIIKLDGATSALEKKLSCPGFGLIALGNVVSNNIVFTPDGKFCLIPASCDDVVYVVEMSTNTKVATVAVGDQPLILAVNSAGSKAIVSNFRDNTFTIINIDGASSSVLCTKTVGTKPMRVAYDAVTDKFAVGLLGQSTVKTIDPATGNVVGTSQYNAGIQDLEYAEDGSLLVLTSAGSFYKEDNAYQLSAKPICFDYNNLIDGAITVSPGPDLIQYLPFSSSGVADTNIKITGLPQLSVSPNPGAEYFSFIVRLPTSSKMTLVIYDLNGRLMATVEDGFAVAGTHTFSWSDVVPSGIYAVKLQVGGKTVSSLLTVCR